MLDYLALAPGALLRLSWQLFRNLPAEGWRHVWKRLPLLLMLWGAFIILSLLHLLGFILDELLFAPYRRQPVDRPVFIVGIPRSGTTHLHRVLAHDGAFSSLTTWEVLLAPTISERYLWRFLARVLSPLAGLAGRLGRVLSRDMDSIHRIRLAEPEEDFLLLLWVGHCFLQALLCPAADSYWQLGDFDRKVPRARQDRVMRYYRRCLQKHLYFHRRHHSRHHGSDSPQQDRPRLLSKNPSFTSMLDALRRQFPDACIVACHRPPAQALPSQLSSLLPALRLLGDGTVRPPVRDRFMALLHEYYRVIRDAEAVSVVAMQQLQGELAQTVHALYRVFQLDLSADFAATLEALHEKSLRYRSAHHYEPGDFDLSTGAIDDYFADVWPLPGPTTAEQV